MNRAFAAGDEPVTVAIPVLNAGPRFGETLAAVRRQSLERPVELLVIDSGSTDGSLELARAHGASVHQIPAHEFSHGGTRDLAMRLARGSHVAFLTQDAAPRGDEWLARMLEGFGLASDVALVCGPYLPRPDAPVPVRRELAEYFHAMAPSGEPHVYRTADGRAPAVGIEAYFSSANGCVARWAWERVPFRAAPYAEDQLLARDMMQAGYAKVFHPGAAVIHSHRYGALGQLRRFFDEWRGLREVHGHVQPLAPKAALGELRRQVARDRAYRRRHAVDGSERDAILESLAYHGLRALGARLGSRADRLPPAVRGWLSLEGRRTFEPAAASGDPAGQDPAHAARAG